MTPEQKRAAGKGVVGYIRVSSMGQTDGGSLGNQKQTIRDWAARHALPIIAIEVAPDGFESGATSFDDRAGWQAVERHLASGQVGWIAVTAIDRLSRDLGALADRIRVWTERDIAIVAPAQGYEQLDGIGPFMLHIWGMMADHERKRLLGRVLPGMEARLHAGLPLGTQPFGYRVEIDAPVCGQRPRRHLMPDPATAPMVVALYRQALARPEWGDRRMAAWAQKQWTSRSWSPGGISKLLSNPVYTGVLRGSVRGKAVLLLNNHPALISAADHGRLQAIRAQRKQDAEIKLNAVSATSWLGGIVQCGRCGGSVTWRSFTARNANGSACDGQYYCIGTAPSADDAPPSRTCGAVWSKAIENLVWRAVEILLEREAGLLRRIVADAVDKVPEYLDDRRQRAAADLVAIDAEETMLTDALAEGRLDSGVYTEAIRTCGARRDAARLLLVETDGLTYLSQLITLREGPHAGRLRWVTLQESRNRLSLPEQRRLLLSLSSAITIQDPERMRSLDGPSENHERGIFTGVTFDHSDSANATSIIVTGMARLLVSQPGHDLAAGLEREGWNREETDDAPPSWNYGEKMTADGIPTARITISPSNTSKS